MTKKERTEIRKQQEAQLKEARWQARLRREIAPTKEDIYFATLKEARQKEDASYDRYYDDVLPEDVKPSDDEGKRAKKTKRLKLKPWEWGAIIAIAVRDWVTIVLAVAVAVYIVYTAYRTVKDGLGDNYVCIVGTCIDIERNASANLTRGKAGRVKSLAMETPDGLVFRIILSGHREAKTMRGLREGDVLEMYVSKSTLFISQNDEYVIRQFYTLQRSDKRTIDIVRKELDKFTKT